MADDINHRRDEIGCSDNGDEAMSMNQIPHQVWTRISWSLYTICSNLNFESEFWIWIWIWNLHVILNFELDLYLSLALKLNLELEVNLNLNLNPNPNLHLNLNLTPTLKFKLDLHLDLDLEVNSIPGLEVSLKLNFWIAIVGDLTVGEEVMSQFKIAARMRQSWWMLASLYKLCCIGTLWSLSYLKSPQSEHSGSASELTSWWVFSWFRYCIFLTLNSHIWKSWQEICTMQGPDMLNLQWSMCNLDLFEFVIECLIVYLITYNAMAICVVLLWPDQLCSRCHVHICVNSVTLYPNWTHTAISFMMRMHELCKLGHSAWVERKL